MAAKWGCCAVLALCLGLLAGCRTTQPNVKPEKTVEKLVEPPQEARYESTGYPKQALDKQADPSRALDLKAAGGVLPSRTGSLGGAGGAGGAGGMGGYR